MSDKPICRDCSDFGPICPNSGKPCALAHTGQAVDKDSLTAEAAPAGEVASTPDKFWCETCEGGGMIIHPVRGDCSCPDCDGKGYWTRATPAAEPAAPGYVDRADAVNLARNALDEYGPGVTQKGVRLLAKAVMLMDAALSGRASQSAPSPVEDKDGARFNWFFGPADKISFMPTYMEGMRKGWTPDEWRDAIDQALAQEGAKE